MFITSINREYRNELGFVHFGAAAEVVPGLVEVEVAVPRSAPAVR